MIVNHFTHPFHNMFITVTGVVRVVTGWGKSSKSKI